MSIKSNKQSDKTETSQKLRGFIQKRSVERPVEKKKKSDGHTNKDSM